MANKADKWHTNIAGKFYVDQQCIDCDLCRETAPSFFTRSDEGGHSLRATSSRPPKRTSPYAWRALEGCPVEAIGDDGEKE